MSRVRRFTLLAAIVLVAAQLGTWTLDAMAPQFPHFLRFLVMYLAVKLFGDLAYFALWPERREWVFFQIYLLDDFLTYLRFAFLGTVLQRLLEVSMIPPWMVDAPPATLTHHIVAGPYLAVGMLLVNRWLREEAEENAYRQARHFLHLP